VRGEHCEAQRLCGAGHAGVVGDEGTEVVPDLERGRQVQSVERTPRDGLYACAINCGTRRRTARMTSTSMTALARLVAVGRQQLPQRARLGFLDDKLDERRRVAVDQSRSSRIS
jgi:hypothetical protein